MKNVRRTFSRWTETGDEGTHQVNLATRVRRISDRWKRVDFRANSSLWHLMADKNEIERRGINAVERIFLEMGWLFREQTVSDYGIDAQAEPKDGDAPSGQLIALQIKTGKSYFRKRGNNFVYYGEDRHLIYWKNHVLPVFIILHDVETDLTLWQRIDPSRVSAHSGGRWSIEIPPTQVLDHTADPYLRRGIASDPASIRRFRLALDVPLIREVAERTQNDSAILVVDEWINKTLNFRESRLYFGNHYGGAEHEFSTWLPRSDINELMLHYFPWLDYEYAEEIENSAGEVDSHTLEISVNELGRAVLTVEGYIEDGGDLKDVQPPGNEMGDDSGFDEEAFRHALDKSWDE